MLTPNHIDDLNQNSTPASDPFLVRQRRRAASAPACCFGPTVATLPPQHFDRDTALRRWYYAYYGTEIPEAPRRYTDDRSAYAEQFATTREVRRLSLHHDVFCALTVAVAEAISCIRCRRNLDTSLEHLWISRWLVVRANT